EIALGSSRVLLGIDADSSVFGPKGSCYNLAIDGSRIPEVLSTFKHALANQPRLRLVVFGLDMEKMGDNSPPPGEFDHDRLGIRTLNWKDFSNALLSVDALSSSISTIVKSRRGAKPYFSQNGDRIDESVILSAPFQERWAEVVGHKKNVQPEQFFL